MNTQKGFTLIELMIVIAIIAILAAIALPAYTNYVAKSQVTEAITLASSYKTPVSLYVTEEGVCPNNAVAGFTDKINTDGSNIGQFVKSVKFSSATNGGCIISATLGDKGVNSKVTGGTITLTSTAPALADEANDNDVVKWTCTADSKISQSLLPKSCKGAGVSE